MRLRLRILRDRFFIPATERNASAFDMNLPAKPWRVTCSCGWELECSSEWAAGSVMKLHPQLAPMDVAHVTRVERPYEGAAAHEQQLALT
jgi:hypothetical protein